MEIIKKIGKEDRAELTLINAPHGFIYFYASSGNRPRSSRAFLWEASWAGKRMRFHELETTRT